MEIVIICTYWSSGYYLRYEMGIIPAFQSAIFMKAGLAKSKWTRGGLHHPPLLVSSPQFGGHMLVAVTTVTGEP